MLDTDTKRRIDTARDILVGKVPDPKSQVEQITIALIYKFMDDMDAESEEFGGKRKFFAGQFARYGWAKLMRSGLGGHEVLNLYAEGIGKMPENPGIPLLFRNIFKNAYLPYRDPETLKSFLKVIDEFNYDHSERLGDAFEYLLSVLGSQGDAGQFRTPRHIIDFIVEVVDPKKDETILDPACGTAGFLISSYKHILRANTLNMDRQDGQDETKKKGQKNGTSVDFAALAPLGERVARRGAFTSRGETGEGVSPMVNANVERHTSAGKSDSAGKALISCSSSPSMFSSLTPDEKGRLAKNIKGYDISPDMVRLSLVNLYLHGFTDPHIDEYDTLTSEEKWNEFANVILANPPFMSPKGGIKPHKRFSVQSKRSEVLFVDYMAEHLTPSGRAGIIVPEGIIFQSQGAYTELRKMLMENSLVAVVSMPAGVFNPYSGVKTSILILDKSLAKKASTIGFFKVENDGFGLGAQRREIEKNDLPQIQAEIAEYMRRLRAGESVEDFQPTMGLIVPKHKIAANGDYNLGGERYREASNDALRKWPMVELGKIARLINGRAYKQEELLAEGPTPVLRVGNFFSNRGWYYSDLELEEDKYCNAGDLLYAWSASFGPRIWEGPRAIYHYHIWKVEPTEAVEKMFLFHLLAADSEKIKAEGHGIAMIHATKGGMEERKFPLPPLEVQKEIVAEIEGYQKVIDGARAVLDNYRPHIPIHPDWPMVAVGDVVEFVSGLTVSIPEVESEGGTPIIAINNVTEDGTLTLEGLRWIAPPKKTLNYLRKGDLLFNWRNGSKHLVGKTALFDMDGQYLFASFLLGVRAHPNRVDSRYLWHTLNIYRKEGRYLQFMRQNVNGLFNREELKMVKIPLPALATQQAIVAEIEAEQALVAANRELIARFERKIQATLARVWGEEAG